MSDQLSEEELTRCEDGLKRRLHTIGDENALRMIATIRDLRSERDQLCSIVEHANSALRLKDEEIANLRKRVKELEEQLAQRFTGHE